MQYDKFPGHRARAFVFAALFAFALRATAQSPMLLYGDALANGWQNWSWGTVNFANTNPVQSQTRSIGASLKYDEAVSFWHATMDTTAYESLSFWIHGGAGGGQRLQVVGLLGTTAQPGRSIGPLAANTWTNIVIPLSQLGVANKTNFNRLWLQLARNGTTNSFYLDTVNLLPKPAPSPIHISVNATQTVRSVDSHWFGANTAIWDGDFDTPTTSSLVKEMGLTILRFPGGSASDDYHWQSNKSGTNTWQWTTSFSKFAHIATNVGAQVIITANYGSGTPAEAAGWVRQANVINKFGFKYWEIGNENYGTWENDTNALKNHAYTYATRAKDYFQQMKAVDPTIKIGVVAAPGENSYQNGYTDHPTVNPRTGTTNYGWTPILLKTLKNLGVTPDFVVHHHYPQWTDANNPVGSNSDDLLLQGTAIWREQAADLRQQITDYFGAGGANIELVVTENNSDAGAQGRQSTSLVNGLYYADSLGQLAQTEFNAFVWWDLRNGTDTTGNFDPLLYGWRTYGDLGMINGLNTKHPTFYTAKLMQYFARGGDTVLSASTDYPLLSAYASRRASGALSVLVVNKDRVSTFNGAIALRGYQPDPAALVRSYGILQDEATRTNGPAAAQDLATNQISFAATNFNYNFPPLSVTLVSLVPTAPTLITWPLSASPPGSVVLQLNGQPGARYFLQSSTNMTVWATVSTNLLTGPTLMVTNPISSGAPSWQWRALWTP
jgi:hypothetical protein